VIAVAHAHGDTETAESDTLDVTTRGPKRLAANKFRQRSVTRFMLAE